MPLFKLVPRRRADSRWHASGMQLTIYVHARTVGEARLRASRTFGGFKVRTEGRPQGLEPWLIDELITCEVVGHPHPLSHGKIVAILRPVPGPDPMSARHASEQTQRAANLRARFPAEP